jgi:sugar (pentulose or hexulose) kinase
VSGKRVGNL